MTDPIPNSERPLPEMYPGVNCAYDFVLPSYQWMLARFEATSNRLQTLLGFATTVTLAVPAIATSIRKDVQFSSPWFLCAFVLFGLIMIIGLVARARGSLALANPKVLYQSYLYKTEWEFRKDAIYWASEHFETNASIIDSKAWLATVMTVLFVIETIMLLIWLADGFTFHL